MSQDIVLSFSGGLDTSFCVPYLQEQGYAVHSVFANTGGVSDEELVYIEQRAHELGVASHQTLDLAQPLFDSFVTPFIWCGEKYQNQYPLLVSDRYLIVEHSLKRCQALGTKKIAHGCTGMGNDQVRFDLSIHSLGDYEIIAPIREIQKQHTHVRQYEQKYLEQRGFAVPSKQKAYTINENLLGITMSGGEIDLWQAPSADLQGWCAKRGDWPTQALQVRIGFEKGVAISVNGELMLGGDLLKTLNKLFAEYGVGQGLYTGDTSIGLKGRIVFEAPGLTALQVAHQALEEAVLSKQQNRFKPMVGRKWVELVYEGFYFDPLKADLEAYLASSQVCVNGEVTLRTEGGSVLAVAVSSKHILQSQGATYAQSANWSATEAEGFIKLFGMSSNLWAKINSGKDQ